MFKKTIDFKGHKIEITGFTQTELDTNIKVFENRYNGAYYDCFGGSEDGCVHNSSDVCGKCRGLSKGEQS